MESSTNLSGGGGGSGTTTPPVGGVAGGQIGKDFYQNYLYIEFLLEFMEEANIQFFKTN